MTMEQLTELSELHNQIYELEESLQTLRSKTHPAASRVTGMPHGSGISDRTAILAVEIAEMEQEIADLREQLEAKKAVAAAFIKTIPNIETRTIFRLRFLHGMLWKEVGHLIGKTDAAARARCYNYMKQLDSQRSRE